MGKPIPKDCGDSRNKRWPASTESLPSLRATKKFFREQYGVHSVRVIPTGVDLDYFDYRPPPRGREIVFTGSMDWMANQDGIRVLHG